MSEIEELIKLSHENSYKLGYVLRMGLGKSDICKIDDDKKELTPNFENVMASFVNWWWDSESLKINGEENRLRYKIYNDNYRFFELFFSDSTPPKVRYEVYTSLIKAYNERFHDVVKSHVLKNIHDYKKHRNDDDENFKEKCLDEIDRLWLVELKR